MFDTADIFVQSSQLATEMILFNNKLGELCKAHLPFVQHIIIPLPKVGKMEIDFYYQLERKIQTGNHYSLICKFSNKYLAIGSINTF